MENETKKDLKLPSYLKAFYGGLYGSKFWSALFDNKIFQTIFTLGYNLRLKNAVLKEIRTGRKVLQIGATFGSLIENVAERIGAHAQYDIMDVSLFQLQQLKHKHQYIYPQINYLHRDGSKKGITEKYDIVICYMLLHEVPPATKVKIIENALEAIKDDGKVIFVDYSNPLPYHPLRYVVRMFNRLYQPFAEKLWDLNIADYCQKHLQYNWRKNTYFGHFYQKVVVTKRNPGNDV